MNIRTKSLTGLFASLLLLCSVASAKAGVTVGGEMRLETSYAFSDSEASEVGKSYATLGRFSGNDSFLDLSWQNDDKTFEAYSMIGLDTASDGDNAFTRQVWFQYNADSWSLRFGQAATIADRYWANQLLADALGLEGYGKAHFVRKEQVRLSVGEQYRFMFALESPKARNAENADDAEDSKDVWVNGGQIQSILPTLVASAELSFDRIQLQPWVRYELVQVQGTDDFSDSYNSLDLGLGITGDFGLVGFTVAGAYGLNTSQESPIESGLPRLNDKGKVDGDVAQFGVWGELRIQQLNFGAGYASSSRSDWKKDPYTTSAFVSYAIPFGPMQFVPEVVWFNDGEDKDGKKNGSKVYAGLSTYLSF